MNTPNQWIVRVATGEFIGGGFVVGGLIPPQLNGAPDPAYAVVALPDETMPNQLTERYDATSPTRRRGATSAEIAATTTAALAAQAAVALSTQQVAKAVLAEVLEVKLGRQLTTADIPTLQGMFARAVVYYEFIVQNGL